VERETQAVGEAKTNSEAIASLLKQVGKGDRSALLVLYDRTSPLLFGIVLRVLGDKALAEEALLDVYTHIWSQTGAYNPGLFTPLEWLVAVARSRAIARLHQTKRDKRRQKAAAGLTDSPMTVAPEQQKAARASIASLIPAQQEILEWAYYSGLSCGEIAVQIGKPVGAVKTHARLALSKLEDLPHPFPEQEEGSISGEP
jgi:RNA polymerase sigma-70 factor (ECF subfamily)